MTEDDRRWGSAKHTRMNEQLEQLRRTTRAKIIAEMGPPDRIAKADSELWGMALGPDAPTDGELLIYEWRGLHDFVWFLVDGDAVQKADWWMAYE